MVCFTAQLKNRQGHIEEKKFELRNPELEKWLEDAGEGLSGINFADD